MGDDFTNGNTPEFGWQQQRPQHQHQQQPRATEPSQELEEGWQGAWASDRDLEGVGAGGAKGRDESGGLGEEEGERGIGAEVDGDDIDSGHDDYDDDDEAHKRRLWYGVG